MKGHSLRVFATVNTKQLLHMRTLIFSLSGYTYCKQIFFPIQSSFLIPFTIESPDRTRGNGIKVKRLNLDIRNYFFLFKTFFFTLRVVRRWHRVPRAAVDI